MSRRSSLDTSTARQAGGHAAFQRTDRSVCHGIECDAASMVVRCAVVVKPVSSPRTNQRSHAWLARPLAENGEPGKVAGLVLGESRRVAAWPHDLPHIIDVSQPHQMREFMQDH